MILDDNVKLNVKVCQKDVAQYTGENGKPVQCESENVIHGSFDDWDEMEDFIEVVLRNFGDVTISIEIVFPSEKGGE